ncbi:hypothetical protein PMI40_01798, partial [Herbaspirillum sp. YR522]
MNDPLLHSGTALPARLRLPVIGSP